MRLTRRDWQVVGACSTVCAVSLAAGLYMASPWPMLAASAICTGVMVWAVRQ